MSKNELLSSVEQTVESLFSSYSTYDAVKEEACAAYEEFIKSSPDAEGMETLLDFLLEHTMKSAIKIAMEQTVTLLCDSGALKLDD